MNARLPPLDSSSSPDCAVVVDVARRVAAEGGRAVLVGGWVRDALLAALGRGRPSKDLDVEVFGVSLDTLRRILAVAGPVDEVGASFAVLRIKRVDVDFSLPRRDTKDGAGHRGFLVEADPSMSFADAARRRDFTINGLFFDPVENEIIDWVDGLPDIEAGLLRTIGDPDVRMAEDPVRILRAIKFATRLGFRIHDDTWQAMCDASSELARAAPPRVLEEIMRLCVSGTALGAFRMMRACGALAVLLPGVDAFIGRRDDPDPAAHDRADSYWRLLEALDADVHAGREPSRALCLAAMWLRVIEREADPETRSLPGQPGDLFDTVSEVLEPLVQDSRLPRRTFITTRRMIVDQARFQTRPGGDPRSLVFTTTDGFEEALNLYRLRSAAWGQGWDMYEAWTEAREEVASASPDELAALRKRGRRRRSRRPRRRRRKPSAD